MATRRDRFPRGAYLPHKYWAFVPGRYLALRTTPPSSTVNGNFGPKFHKPFAVGPLGPPLCLGPIPGNGGVGGDSLIIKTLSSPPTVP